MKKALLAGISVAACVYATAQAQPIEEVVVTGRLEAEVPQLLAQVGNRVETVTSDEIENLGYVDVGQALQNQVPGLYIAPLSGAFDYHESSYQGSRTTEMLWLVDGVRINNRLYATTPPIDTIPAHMVERIEVLEGGQALFYGTQAVAGAINIVTKEFSDTLNGAISVGVGGDEERHINGYLRDTIGPHKFVVYASKDEAEGFQPFRDQDYQPSATDRKRSYDVFTVGGKYGIDLGDNARFSVNYQHTTATLDFLRPKSIATAFNERDEDLLSAKLDWAPTAELEFFLKGYYHWWDAHFTEIDNSITSPGTLIVIDDNAFWGFDDYGVNALAKYTPGGPLEFFAGYDFQNYSGRDDVLLIAPQTESVHAPFAQIRTTDSFLPNARFSAGVRHNIPSEGDSSTVWNVSGRWDISPNLFARATGGTAFRLPSAYELFVDDTSEKGNPNLEPETSINFNASLGGMLSFGMTDLRWEAVGFYREVSNLIENVAHPVLTGVETFANTGPKVEVRGGELILGAEFADTVSADFSYSFNSSEALGTGTQLADVPEALMKVMLDYHPANQPFGASLTVNHVGGVYRIAAGRQEYGGYTVVDLGARVFLDTDRQHRIGVRVQNLFDETYTTRVRTTTPDGGGAAYAFHFLGTPRTFHINYTYEFGM